MQRLRTAGLGLTGLSLAGDGAGVWVANPGRSVSIAAFVIGVGVYGMDVADSPFAVPEPKWTAGTPAVIIGMGLVAAIVLVHFRRRGWL